MANDDDFFADLEEKPELPKPDTSGKVVKRVLMEMKTFLVYPNGNMSIVQAESKMWFKDSKEMWKKKKKPKAKAVKKAVIQKEEAY